mmetsp:Transcript_4941/g.9082  ORF Transcript_4941/g.9082 Transcript_4941/m.9082 type:complete len:326 (-) Transcript_4941:321-1298(-)
MSLFKAREWWQAKCGHEEEYDTNCLCIANIDNDPAGYLKLITGSFQGFLRIYLPRRRDFRPEDLLLETELESCILGLAAGRFTTAGSIQLAVLHPRKLVVYSVQAHGGSFLQLHRHYEHWLEHTAANMTIGPFGGVQGSDFICVQSYDGQLSFFEHEVVAFSRHLPRFLVPGPMVYAEASDLIVVATASFEIEAFKYKVLAAAAASGAGISQGAGYGPSGGGASDISGAKKVVAEWRTIIGEAAVDIKMGRFFQSHVGSLQDIVILGEHTVFVLTASVGQVVFQRRLEFHPAAACLYSMPSGGVGGGSGGGGGGGGGGDDDEVVR